MSEGRSETSLDERLHFLGLGENERTALRNFWPVVEARLPEILEGFYSHIQQVPELSRLISGGTDRLKQAQATHWQRLFAARFDADYVRSVRAIGMAHNRIGLEPRWYIGAYSYVLRRLTALAVATHRFSPSRATDLSAAIGTAVMLDMDLAISVYQEALLEERQRRQDAIAASIAEFDTLLGSVVDDLHESASGLERTAAELTESAEIADGRAGSSVAASEQASQSVQTVASAGEELAGSIDEIARQVARSSEICGQAVEESGRATEEVRSLVEVAQRIGTIVGLIQDIAAQTNLLALNATIEAARAGEAGKGFAVVASEVKSLATQTAKATEDISRQIDEIQGATGNAAEAIDRISRIIADVNDLGTGVAAAVEQQGAATREIAGSVQQASCGTQEVSAGMREVTEAAARTKTAATETRAASARIFEQANGLRQEVGTFFERMANA